MADITVIIPTYNRPKILARAVAGFALHGHYRDGAVRFLVGNDGEPLPEQLMRRFDGFGVKVLEGPKRGLGANLNMLLHEADTDLIFQMDDDHVLTSGLDLAPHARFLQEDPKGKHGWIRLMFGHSQERTVWPRDYYRFVAQLYKSYWRVLPSRSELWVPSNRPHLKHKGFHDYYGYYSENVKLGETEQEFCARWNKMIDPGAPGVFIPFNPPYEDTWAHVGESWQHTEHDRREDERQPH